jgi:hypothetical protein
MNKIFAAVVIAAAFGMASTSANAGIFSGAAQKVLKPVQKERAETQKKVAAGGQYGYFADKPYMQCIQGMGAFSRNEQERQQGVRSCNKRYGYPNQ